MPMVAFIHCLCLLLLVNRTRSLTLHARNVSRRLALQIPVFSSLLPSHVLAVDGYQDGPQGLKYKVTETGSGEKPQRAQKIKTSYTLYLNGFPDQVKNAIQIDSSKNRLLGTDKPFEFNAGVSQVVKGWDLALLDMRQGESRRLVVPPDLGYGSKGAGSKIPGGSTLYFEVKLTDLGTSPKLNEKQKQWLEEHPL